MRSETLISRRMSKRLPKIAETGPDKGQMEPRQRIPRSIDSNTH
jgi:hypothetical protein